MPTVLNKTRRLPQKNPLPSPSGRGAGGEGEHIVLLLTGRRHGCHVRTHIDGKPADLTRETFHSLIKLVLARAFPPSPLAGEGPGLRGLASGLTPVPKNAIYRLRKAIEAAVGKGAGLALIETGSGEEYRLAIRAKQFRARVALTPCFFELVGRKMLTQEEADQMRRICRMCSRKETEKLLGDD